MACHDAMKCNKPRLWGGQLGVAVSIRPLTSKPCTGRVAVHFWLFCYWCWTDSFPSRLKLDILSAGAARTGPRSVSNKSYGPFSVKRYPQVSNRWTQSGHEELLEKWSNGLHRVVLWPSPGEKKTAPLDAPELFPPTFQREDALQQWEGSGAWSEPSACPSLSPTPEAYQSLTARHSQFHLTAT